MTFDRETLKTHLCAALAGALGGLLWWIAGDLLLNFDGRYFWFSILSGAAAASLVMLSLEI